MILWDILKYSMCIIGRSKIILIIFNRFDIKACCVIRLELREATVGSQEKSACLSLGQADGYVLNLINRVENVR